MDSNRNSGDNNSGDYNAGDYNSGDYNSGNYNSGDCNSGYRNAGDYNSGNYNSGDYNAGNYNAGDNNSGYCNSGYCNAGDYNSGDYNSGDRNSGDYNSGFFNTNEPNVRMFNKETNLKYSDIELPSFCFFKLTEWVYEKDMTDEEKELHPTYKTTAGYLKCYEYKEAFKNSYLKADKEDREKIKELPNFDADIFYEISGIKIDEEVEEITMEELCKELGREIKIKK